MSRFQDNPQGFDPRRRVVMRPRTPRKRYRFRWGIIWGLLALLVAAWLLQNITCEPSVTWEGVMDALRIKNRERYTQLACWGIALCGVAAVVRILRKNKGEE